MADDKHTENLSSGEEGSIRQEGDKLIITIPNPKGKSAIEIGQLAGHDCSSRCSGLVSNAAAFVF
jgi:hypothetical protein